MQPQSIVHALVRLTDGALLAHLGLPDMRVPIAYALAYPDRARLPGSARLDLAAGLVLPFEAPDPDTFRCLALARIAGEAGGLAPCALNAADEEAVAAFLAGRCSFLEIPELVERALDAVEPGPLEQLEQVVRADAAARAVVRHALPAGVAPMSVPLAIGGLLLLVFIHELGHFLAAKGVGMRATRFSVGFGPALLSRTRGDTEYRLAALPLGGYVKIVGMARPRSGDLANVGEAVDEAARVAARRPPGPARPRLPPHARRVRGGRRRGAEAARGRAAGGVRRRCRPDRPRAPRLVPARAHARARRRRPALLLARRRLAPHRRDRRRPPREHPHRGRDPDGVLLVRARRSSR